MDGLPVVGRLAAFGLESPGGVRYRDGDPAIPEPPRVWPTNVLYYDDNLDVLIRRWKASG
jgi:hypothetical protein